MFKAGDIVTYKLPDPVYSEGMQNMVYPVSAVKYDALHPSGLHWCYSRPTMEEINGITAVVGYVDYSEHSPYSGGGYIYSGNYQIAVSVKELTPYTGVVNPEAFKRSW